MSMTQWKLKAFLDENNVTPYKLASYAGRRISSTTVYNAVGEDYQGPSLEMLDKFLVVLSEIVERPVRLEEILSHEYEHARAA